MRFNGLRRYYLPHPQPVAAGVAQPQPVAVGAEADAPPHPQPLETVPWPMLTPIAPDETLVPAHGLKV